MNDLSELGRRVLRALTTAPVAWQAPIQLAVALGGDRDATLDAIADLDAIGWLAPWELAGDLYVTLTPRAAGRLGVKLVPGGRSETMRWAPIDDPEPSPRAAGRGQGDVDALDLIPDDSPGPEAEAEAAERAERVAAARARAGQDVAISTLPRPSVLLGAGLTPWPGPAESAAGAEAGACPGCGSGPIPEKAYCLVCDRWGLDHMLEAPARPLAAGRHRRPTPNAPRVALGDPSARAARKAKIRRKLARLADQERAARASKPRPI